MFIFSVLGLFPVAVNRYFNFNFNRYKCTPNLRETSSKYYWWQTWACHRTSTATDTRKTNETNHAIRHKTGKYASSPRRKLTVLPEKYYMSRIIRFRRFSSGEWCSFCRMLATSITPCKGIFIFLAFIEVIVGRSRNIKLKYTIICRIYFLAF